MVKGVDLLGSIPLISVIVGAIIGAKVKIPDTPRAVLLSVAAGLVTASLFTDIAPAISEAEGSIALCAPRLSPRIR
jgi:hypothetical protein